MGCANKSVDVEHKSIDEVDKRGAHTVVSERGLAGAIGGCATRFFCQPFDVLKIRFQVSMTLYEMFVRY